MTDYYNEFVNSFERLEKEGANFVGLQPLPSNLCVTKCAREILELMFPGRDDGGANQPIRDIVLHQLKTVRWTLSNLIYLSYNHECEQTNLCPAESRAKTNAALENLFKELPNIRKKIKKDAQAGFENDPAANDVHEIILSYPFIKAITIHRVAHNLFKFGVPLLPRMLSEWAHSDTGIDIHPGATIGENFFIDHGTGVVIGETTVIGNNVKIYQGVTLGALSFPKDEGGQIIRGAKRHPTISDNVTIYANATILGDIVIGKNCIIGSSSWIKDDVDEDTLVTIPDPEIIHRKINIKK
ncbi:MAG: serine O-acetyltransferase EpsC [Sphaerochaetaceae bacterium]|jgi:serine O-acetyltransferase